MKRQDPKHIIGDWYRYRSWLTQSTYLYHKCKDGSFSGVEEVTSGHWKCIRCESRAMREAVDVALLTGAKPVKSFRYREKERAWER